MTSHLNGFLFRNIYAHIRTTTPVNFQKNLMIPGFH